MENTEIKKIKSTVLMYIPGQYKVNYTVVISYHITQIMLQANCIVLVILIYVRTGYKKKYAVSINSICPCNPIIPNNYQN